MDDHKALVTLANVALGPGYGDGPPAVIKAGRGLPPVLVDCLLERSVVGKSKYGRLLPIGWPLATAGAFQEALDLLVYLASDTSSTRLERWAARWVVRSLARRLQLRCHKQLYGACDEATGSSAPNNANHRRC